LGGEERKAKTNDGSNELTSYNRVAVKVIATIIPQQGDSTLMDRYNLEAIDMYAMLTLNSYYKPSSPPSEFYFSNLKFPENSMSKFPQKNLKAV